MRSVAAIVLLLLWAGALAQEQPVVRVAVSPGEVTVGESAELKVTVLVPTWFPKPPVYPGFEVANAITRLPPDSSYPTSERVGRDTWSGIVRNYRIYPLTAATYRLENLAMTVTWANPGADAYTAEVAVPEIVVRSVVPPGAEGLDPYIAGNRFNLSREIDGNVESLEAGDALVIRHVAELEGLPAIFIPPMSRIPEMPGVSIYADEPVLEDGDVARRVEQFTLVFEAGGEFSLPGIDLDWWNLGSQTVQTESLPALDISVVGPAVAAAVEQEAAFDIRCLAAAAVSAVLAFLLLLRYVPRVLQWRLRRRQEYLGSEEYALRQFELAARSGKPADTYAGMTAWLARLRPDTGIREFSMQYGDAGLQQQVDTLARYLFAAGQRSPDLQALYEHARAARRAFRAAQVSGTDRALPPINPVSGTEKRAGT